MKKLRYSRLERAREAARYAACATGRYLRDFGGGMRRDRLAALEREAGARTRVDEIPAPACWSRC